MADIEENKVLNSGLIQQIAREKNTLKLRQQMLDAREQNWAKQYQQMWTQQQLDATINYAEDGCEYPPHIRVVVFYESDKLRNLLRENMGVVMCRAIGRLSSLYKSIRAAQDLGLKTILVISSTSTLQNAAPEASAADIRIVVH